VAKEAFVLFNGTAGAGYGDSGDPVDARAYSSGLLHVEANAFASGTLNYSLSEYDETTNTYTAIVTKSINAPGSNQRSVTELPGTHYRIEWVAPASGAHIVATLIMEDE
jgi:hypothetical protein